MTTLEQLEAALSPDARHALGSYRTAFERGDPNATVADIHKAIETLYGRIVAEELRNHLAARTLAVLPQK